MIKKKKNFDYKGWKKYYTNTQFMCQSHYNKH